MTNHFGHECAKPLATSCSSWRLVAYAGLALGGLGAAWLALFEPGADVALGVAAAGAATAIVAGIAGAIRVRPRAHAFAGKLWFEFWDSPLGAWTARIAGLGLRFLHSDALQSGDSREQRRAASYEVPEVVRLVDTQVANIHAWIDGAHTFEPPAEEEVQQRLMGSLTALEALRLRLQDIDHRSAGAGTVSADLAAARKVCEMVEVMLGAGEGGRGGGGCSKDSDIQETQTRL